ncbi:MAG: hypothetical protein K2G45_02085 [Lachnospiraceae bacterium]|nr:hypothetical protein [Lachnospiraceae bacterium]
MYATKFIYNGHSSDEYGIIIASFDGNEGVVDGGEVEVTAVQTPGKDVYDYYTSQFPNVLTWNFSVIKNPCIANDEMWFSSDEERHIVKWLMGEDGYHELYFEQEDYIQVFYMAYCNVKPRQINGRTIGFNITATSNCGYGFSKEYVRTDNFIVNGENKTIQIQVNNDLKRKVYPQITIKNGSGDFTITNSDISGNVICKSSFKNITGTLEMDSQDDIITGLTSPDCFVNWNFLYLVDGMNELTCDCETNVELTVKYREIRRVIV